MLIDPELEEEDKKRLFLLWFSSVETEPPRDFLEEVEGLLSASLDGTTKPWPALRWMKKQRQLTRAAQAMTSQQATPNTPSNLLQSHFSKFSKHVSQLSSGSSPLSNLVGSIKTLLPQHKDLPITRWVERVLDGTDLREQALPGHDEIGIWDPKVPKRSAQLSLGGKYTDVVVFVIGGGTVQEYLNLNEMTEVCFLSFFRHAGKG